MAAATVRLEVVTGEKVIFSDEVLSGIAPGVGGELGILPHHARLMTILNAGELFIRKDSEEVLLAIGGGFLEVRPDKIIVLDEGEVVAQGTHNELMQSSPVYQEIYASQLGEGLKLEDQA